MSKVAIVYWSGTGNTETMANAVLAGAIGAGADAAVFRAGDFDPSTVGEYDAIAFGCPSMGSEQLEESEFEPMFSSCDISGKKIGLFGSYGWGDGEWMRTWHDDCAGKGATFAADDVICNEAPDGDAEASCNALGAALAG